MSAEGDMFPPLKTAVLVWWHVRKEKRSGNNRFIKELSLCYSFMEAISFSSPCVGDCHYFVLVIVTVGVAMTSAEQFMTSSARSNGTGCQRHDVTDFPDGCVTSRNEIASWRDDVAAVLLSVGLSTISLVRRVLITLWSRDWYENSHVIVDKLLFSHQKQFFIILQWVALLLSPIHEIMLDFVTEKVKRKQN